MRNNGKLRQRQNYPQFQSNYNESCSYSHITYELELNDTKSRETPPKIMKPFLNSHYVYSTF